MATLYKTGLYKKPQRDSQKDVWAASYTVICSSDRGIEFDEATGPESDPSNGLRINLEAADLKRVSVCEAKLHGAALEKVRMAHAHGNGAIFLELP